MRKMSNNKELEIILASPRGFCAGVDRAIDIVEKSLEFYGAPIYVKHEIVHNPNVVDRLKVKGAIFIENLEDVPIGSYLIFSAHGVSPIVKKEAKNRNLIVLDATCPLVNKVHIEARRYYMNDYFIFLIGHRYHVEVEGTLGYAPKKMKVIATKEEAEQVEMPKNKKLAYITQTTLSLDDTAEIIAILKKRAPCIEGPSKNDICYATQNRQNAVKELCKHVQLVVVVGSENSSNTVRLVELANRLKIKTFLISTEKDLSKNWFDKINKVGITAGASAPEDIVQAVVKKILTFRKGRVKNLPIIKENIEFPLPYELRQQIANKK